MERMHMHFLTKPSGSTWGTIGICMHALVGNRTATARHIHHASERAQLGGQRMGLRRWRIATGDDRHWDAGTQVT